MTERQLTRERDALLILRLECLDELCICTEGLRIMRGMNSTERFKPSVTVAAIIEQDGKFLLVEEHTPEGLKLNNPAGHLDAGESLVQACIREALEETARHFTPTHLLGMYMSRFQRPSSGEDITYLRFAFCGSVSEAIVGQALDTPIVRTLWMSADEIRATQAQHRSPLLLRCMEDYLVGQRMPLESVHTDASVYAA
jgi:phosphatase NudJ